MPRRRLVLAVGALIAALLLIVLTWSARRPPTSASEHVLASQPSAPAGPTAAASRQTTTTPASSPHGSAATTAAPALSSSPRPTGAETPDVAGDDSLLQQPQIVALGRHAADEYRRRAQYPPWSQPLGEDGEDPILRDREVSPISAGGPNGEDPTLVVFPDQVSFEAPDPIVLYAYLSVNDTRVAAAAITAAITNENLQPLAEVTYHDDGTDGDRVGGDLIYTARFAPDADFAPELSESFLVRVVAQTTDGDQRVAATGFLYSNPHARLTGNYRDSLVGGSLVIAAEVEVFRPGRFFLEGTLYDQSGAHGIAEAHTAAELAPGRQWMELVFFGRIINQSQIDGPYLLRFLALSTTTGMPNAKNRLVENALLTGAYRAAQFSAAPFEDQDLLDAAQRLEGDLK